MNLLQLAYLSSRKECMYPKCKSEFDCLIELKGRWDNETLEWGPNAKFLFHYFDTHGFPPELTIEQLSKLVNSEMTHDQIDSYNTLMREGLKL